MANKLIFIFLLITHFSYGQSNEIKIKFIGNCGMYLTDGTTNIYVDFPYKSGAFQYMKFAEAELESIQENSIFIFTHKHADHYSGKNMRKTLRKKKGRKYGKWNINELLKLSESIPDFSIEVFQTRHNLSLKHYSYLITWHGKKLYFNGDTEKADRLLTMTNLDWAFIPIWILEDVNGRKQTIDTKMTGIYHLYPTETYRNDKPEKYKVFDNQGDVICLPF